MDSIKPGQDPSVLPGMDAVTFTSPPGDAADDSPDPGAEERPPRRIEGRFCPFCAGAIPQEFVFCTHCGRNV